MTSQARQPTITAYITHYLKKKSQSGNEVWLVNKI